MRQLVTAAMAAICMTGDCRAGSTTALSSNPYLPGSPGVQERVRLDAILTVVDAKHVLQHLDDQQIEEGAENEVRGSGSCSASAAHAVCAQLQGQLPWRSLHYTASAAHVPKGWRHVVPPCCR